MANYLIPSLLTDVDIHLSCVKRSDLNQQDSGRAHTHWTGSSASPLQHWSVHTVLLEPTQTTKLKKKTTKAISIRKPEPLPQQPKVREIFSAMFHSFPRPPAKFWRLELQKRPGLGISRHSFPLLPKSRPWNPLHRAHLHQCSHCRDPAPCLGTDWGGSGYSSSHREESDNCCTEWEEKSEFSSEQLIILFSSYTSWAYNFCLYGQILHKFTSLSRVIVITNWLYKVVE